MCVKPTDVVVIGGILALYDEAITEMLDLRLYVETDPDVRILRRIRRDVLERGRSLEGVIEQYLSTVKSIHVRFVEPTKKEADLVIPGGSTRSRSIPSRTRSLRPATGSRAGRRPSPNRR